MIKLLPLILFLTVSTSWASPPVVTFTHRFRIETWDNATSLSDATASTCYTRQRSQLGVKWSPTGPMECGLRFGHEFRYYLAPKTTPFNRQEVFVDNLYIKYRWHEELPLWTTVGRFNMNFGEGFVVMDSSPLDGSRSGYFNAIRNDYKPDSLTTISLFYCRTDREDEILPLINNQHQPLADQNEDGFGLYLTRQFGATNVQGYLLQLNGHETTALGKREITTIGGRVEHKFGEGWFAVTEDAYQMGKLGLKDRSAFGGYTRIGCDLPQPFFGLTTFVFGGVYLSGDDQTQPNKETKWDPLWGRWPKWSESFAYTLIPERGPAKWSDFSSIYEQMIFKPTPETKVQLTLHVLGAMEGAASSGTFFGGGKDRGVLGIALIEYKISPKLTGHLLWEKFEPGNYYADGSKGYVWLRTELFLTFDLMK